MNTLILIVVLASYGGRNTTVTMQEFNSMAQCQYAAKLIRESAQRIISIQCINK
jgi:hypothetical protein